MIISIVLTALILTACSSKCEPITKYIPKPEPYAVPVPCKTPEVICGKLIGNAIEKQNKSLECIEELKKANMVCK